MVVLVICFILLFAINSSRYGNGEPPLPDFPGRRAETTRHRALSTRDAMSWAFNRRQPQRCSAISLEDRPVQPPGGSLKVNLPCEPARASLPKLMTPPATAYKS